MTGFPPEGLLPGQPAGEHLAELFFAHGLGQEIIHACFQTVGAVLGRHVGGQSQDRQMGRAPVRTGGALLFQCAVGPGRLRPSISGRWQSIGTSTKSWWAMASERLVAVGDCLGLEIQVAKLGQEEPLVDEISVAAESSPTTSTR